VVRRRRFYVAAVLGAVCLAVLAAGCGGSSNTAAAPAATTTGTTTTTPGGGGPNGAAFQAYRDCLSAHGVTLPARPGGGPGGGTPPAGGGQPPANGTPPAGGGPPGGRFGNLTPKQQAAMTACQSKRPAGGGFGGRGGNANGGQQNPAFAKYTACLKSHGVTFGSTSPSSSTFTKAVAACKNLLPSSTGGSVNGGTTTTQ
jgi:hypothetical protein